MNLKVVLEPGEDGYIVASCPALKGCVSQGKTEDDALANIREAIALYLEADPAEAPERPQHKVVTVAV